MLYILQPTRKRTVSEGSGLRAPAGEDLLQSLRFNTGEHSIAGQRCSQRYEWYQTPSEVVLHVMIPNVKENDILVEFTDKKVIVGAHCSHRNSTSPC